MRADAPPTIKDSLLGLMSIKLWPCMHRRRGHRRLTERKASDLREHADAYRDLSTSLDIREAGRAR